MYALPPLLNFLLLFILLIFLLHSEAAEGEDFSMEVLTESPHAPAEQPNRQFSLDFPPGLVHPPEECEPPKNRWRDLLQIIEGSKNQQPMNRT